MKATDTNYFVCTLGEAAHLQETEGVKSFETIVDLLDQQAKSIPNAPAIGFPALSDSDHSSQSFWGKPFLTFAELNELSASLPLLFKLHHEVHEPRASAALLCKSGPNFLRVWLSLMRSGVPVLLLAPQCNATAIRHLCEQNNVVALYYDEAYTDVALEFEDICVEIPKPAHARQISSTTSVKSSDVAYIHHSSGTSSGLPKSLPLTHQQGLGVLPALDGSAHATFSATPLYHGGVADCLRAWSSGAMIWMFPEQEDAITGPNLMKCLKFAANCSENTNSFVAGCSGFGSGTANSGFGSGSSSADSSQVSAIESDPKVDTKMPGVAYFSSVPQALMMLASEDNGMDMLRSMDLVGVGGASMPSDFGNDLVRQGIKLVSRFGSTECGFLLSSHRDYSTDAEWQYLRFRDGSSRLKLEPQDNGLYELVVGAEWYCLVKRNRPDGSYATSDLLERHPHNLQAYRYNSRADAQIVLRTGKKFDPAPVEEKILYATDLLQDILIFGNDRLCPGALLFPRNRCDMTDSDLLARLWPKIEEINTSSDPHTRLTRNSISIYRGSESDATLEKSSKGTILRNKANEKYQKEIENTYSRMFNSKYATEGERRAPTVETISAMLKEICSIKIGPEERLYARGVDSIQATQLRTQLVHLFGQELDSAHDIPQDIVYRQGTIRGLAEYFSSRLEGKCHDDEKAGDINLVHSMIEEFQQKLVIPESPESPETQQPSSLNVVLTGATGALGAHILRFLRNSPTVSTITCLVRAEDDNRARERIKQIATARFPTSPMDIGEDNAITCLAVDHSKPDLGLQPASYKALVQGTSMMIHSAWNVNFNLPPEDFRDNLTFLTSLLNMSFESAALSGPVSFHFCSSIAAVISSPQSPIPESVPTSPSSASPIGYGLSKYVAEQVCKAANLRAHTIPFSASILRFGQLCSDSKTGIWNATEAYPMLLSSWRLTGCLPDLDEPLNWLPLDVAAEAVGEISLGNTTEISRRDQDETTETSVYHILNPHKQPQWCEALAIFQEFQKNKTGELFQITSKEEWLKVLGEAHGKEKHKDHPSRKLLAFWNDAYGKGQDKGSRPRDLDCDMTCAKKASKSLSNIQPLDKGAMERMWNWIDMTIR
ncbi:MAG: hypothetical protein Q9227_002936 [Pyrenula ochraceoflavens]